MVVGESGLGKSTLVNSLFLTDLYPERVIPDATGNIFYTSPTLSFNGFKKSTVYMRLFHIVISFVAW